MSVNPKIGVCIFTHVLPEYVELVPELGRSYDFHVETMSENTGTFVTGVELDSTVIASNSTFSLNFGSDINSNVTLSGNGLLNPDDLSSVSAIDINAVKLAKSMRPTAKVLNLVAGFKDSREFISHSSNVASRLIDLRDTNGESVRGPSNSWNAINSRNYRASGSAEYNYSNSGGLSLNQVGVGSRVFFRSFVSGTLALVNTNNLFESDTPRDLTNGDISIEIWQQVSLQVSTNPTSHIDGFIHRDDISYDGNYFHTSVSNFGADGLTINMLESGLASDTSKMSALLAGISGGLIVGKLS